MCTDLIEAFSCLIGNSFFRFWKAIEHTKYIDIHGNGGWFTFSGTVGTLSSGCLNRLAWEVHLHNIEQLVYTSHEAHCLQYCVQSGELCREISSSRCENHNKYTVSENCRLLKRWSRWPIYEHLPPRCSKGWQSYSGFGVVIISRNSLRVS